MARTVLERIDVIPLLSEVFREHGYDGTSLSIITVQTGLGKGSLYHFFPGGKEEMADAVLGEIEGWFEASVFEPLRQETDIRSGIEKMLTSVDNYFKSGDRICLVGAFALSKTRDTFGLRIHQYFRTWTDVLCDALQKSGLNQEVSLGISEEYVGGIQGALLLSRALEDTTVFTRTLFRLSARMNDIIPD